VSSVSHSSTPAAGIDPGGYVAAVELGAPGDELGFRPDDLLVKSREISLRALRGSVSRLQHRRLSLPGPLESGHLLEQLSHDVLPQRLVRLGQGLEVRAAMTKHRRPSHPRVVEETNCERRISALLRNRSKSAGVSHRAAGLRMVVTSVGSTRAKEKGEDDERRAAPCASQ
jgi:hypothetical protein